MQTAGGQVEDIYKGQASGGSGGTGGSPGDLTSFQGSQVMVGLATLVEI